MKHRRMNFKTWDCERASLKELWNMSARREEKAMEAAPPWSHEKTFSRSRKSGFGVAERMDFASPLSLKLQQVWLQTQLQKKPSLDSNSPMSSGWDSEIARNDSQKADLEFILDTLMNEEEQASKDNGQSLLLSLEQELLDLISKPEENDFSDIFDGAAFTDQEVWTEGSNDGPLLEFEDISGLFDGLSTCSGSTNMLPLDSQGSSDGFVSCTLSTEIDNFELDTSAPLIQQQEVAWMIDSPVGLEWPKTNQTPHLQAPYASKGSYYQILEGLGLKNLDLVESLVDCARAVSIHDVTKANILVDEIRSKVSPFGTSTQRIVFYFVEALVARMSATGNGLFTAMCHARPTAGTMLKSVKYIMETSPFLSVRYFFPNQVILNACRGHPRIHIIDYGTAFGFQWPSLMQELVKTPGGPPHLCITGIDSPLPGGGTASDVGCMLREYARSIGLPFKFRGISEKWDIDASSLFLRDDEVLVVNCMFRQTNLLDESVLAESPRKVWLNRVRSLNPRVFIQGMNNASYNVPFFMTRFLEALTHFAILFDAIDCTSPADNKERHLLEQEKYGREIVNIVACEGLERVERAETYKQWHSRTQRANFELMSIDPNVYKDAESLMSLYHQDFGLQKDDGWLLLGWKGQILHAFSAWKPAGVGS